MGFEELYAGGSIGWLRYAWMKNKVRLLLHFYDTVFVMSEKLRGYYAPMSKDWVLVHGGVDVDEVPDSSSRARNEKELVIGYMGNARAYQGLPFLLEASAMLKDRSVPVRLNLIVSGELEELKRMLDQYHLSEVTTLHHDVSHEEAFRLIGDSSVVVIPRPSSAITEYAFPGKLAEYLATGIPSIATEIGPIREMRDEFSKHCILIPPEHIAEHLADALQRVNAMSADERQKLGAGARVFAHERFSWDVRGKIFNEQFRG
jgi:glycosyltransferase involved in cell wall biosynthesis